MLVKNPSNTAISPILADFFGHLSYLQDESLVKFKHIIQRLSNHLSDGHTCLSLTTQEIQLIKESQLIGQSKSPLILVQKKLYFQRYWQYEQHLAQNIQTKSTQSINLSFDALLNAYFPTASDQKSAVKKAISNSFCIISGGPGTGKTTTAIRLLAILQTLYQGQLNIAMAAPTGKAAMRLKTAIIKGKQALDETIKEQIPETVSTIHRLLGAKRFSPYFRHHAQYPIVADLVLIDEASMVDLALMSKLVDALKPNTRLILLGDKDQLASVESGAVLADLCQALPDNTAFLEKTWRFNTQIKALAYAVNQAQSEKAWQLLNDPKMPAIRLLRTPLISTIGKQYQPYINALKNPHNLTAIFDAFNQFQVLCSNRTGINGVTTLNYKIEQYLATDLKIKPYYQWYHGRPIIITQNDPSTGLFNGDSGICLKLPQTNQYKVYFEQADGDFKAFSPSRLPQLLSFFAMTIHQSQGSEFERILIVSADKMNPVLNKALFYTAITRAKESVDILVTESCFKSAIQNNTHRETGLVSAIQSI